jgi:hypothetical protein
MAKTKAPVSPDKLPKKSAMAICREMFVLGASRKAIAELIGYSENTVGGWVRDMGIETLRITEDYTPEALMRDMYHELATINAVIKGREQAIPTPAEADARRKIIASIKDLKGGLVLQQYVQCAMEVDRFAQQEFSVAVSAQTKEVLDAFIKRKAREAEVSI